MVWLTSSDICCAQSNHLHVSWTLWNEIMFWRQKKVNVFRSVRCSNNVGHQCKVLFESNTAAVFFHVYYCKAAFFKSIYCIKCYINKHDVTLLECRIAELMQTPTSLWPWCFLNCCFLTAVISLVFILPLRVKCKTHIYIFILTHGWSGAFE